MKEIKFFMMPTCPHCKKAMAMMEKLFEAHPEYKNIDLKQIDEVKEAAYADTFDYHYVPTFYVGDEKLHEGVPTEEAIENVFKSAYAG